jgi:hypothetical protein
MASRWPTLAGVAIGLGVAAGLLTLAGNLWQKPPSSGPLISEHDGHIRELVIQYQPDARDIVLPAYREFLKWLEADIIVDVVAPDSAAFDELVAGVGDIRCTLRPIIVHHAMSAWSRDRWLALASPSETGAITLWSPRGEALSESWPERAGDERIGFDIARSRTPAVRTERSSLYFDGGDFLADNENVFVMPRVLKRNIQITVRDRTELLNIFSRELKRNVVLLNEAPDHHAGMFMASIGQKTMLVGDPSLGRSYFPPLARDAESLLPGGSDFTPETQRLFDAVAAQSQASGYRVVRMPVVPAPDGRTFLTYVNCIIDQQGETRIVYLPYYRGVESLNRAAQKIWEDLGYTVRPVDCTSTYRFFGALHCLVNVLRRV